MISPNQWPTDALVWTSTRQKGDLRRRWRQAVMRRFANSSRVLKVAWTLLELSADKGYAFATDAHLAGETSVPLEKVERALKELQDAGCIIRVHVSRNGRFQRRIFLAAKIIDLTKEAHLADPAIPATVAGQDTRHGGPSNTRHGGGREDTRDTHAYRYQRKEPHRSTVAQVAEADAARRAERARGARPLHWLDEDI